MHDITLEIGKVIKQYPNINLHLAFFIAAAQKLYIHYELITPKIAEFRTPTEKWHILAAMTPLNSMVARTLSGNKYLTHLILNRAGFKTPKFAQIKSFDELQELKNKWQNIVVKPTRGSGGKGITILPHSTEELKKAYEYAASFEKGVLVESFAKGENYRIVTLKNKVLAVIHRKPAHVVGDGTHTIHELIEITNQKHRAKKLSIIKVSPDTEILLKEQGYTFESIPSKGKTVYLHRTSNLSQGGTVEDAKGVLHPKYHEIAIEAAKAIGLNYAAVDLIIEDPKDPGKYVINELNHSPGLRIPYLATGENIGVRVLKEIGRIG